MLTVPTLFGVVSAAVQYLLAVLQIRSDQFVDSVCYCLGIASSADGIAISIVCLVANFVFASVVMSWLMLCVGIVVFRL